MYFGVKLRMNCNNFLSTFNHIIITIHIFMDVIWGSVKCVLCHDFKMLILNLPIKSIAFNQCSLVFNNVYFAPWHM